MSGSPAAGDTGGGSDPLAFDLADRLNKALRIARCKPGEMRAILGVSESTMTNYLSGATQPKDGMLRQWALRCGQPVTFEWLRFGVDAGPENGGDLANASSRCTARSSLRELATVTPMYRQPQLVEAFEEAA